VGCLFIISGTLTITGGTDKGDNGTDIVQGFFIITSEEQGAAPKALTADTEDSLVIPADDYNTLKVIGGIVQRDMIIDNTVGRESKSDLATMNLPPAEEIVYEGGRYISIFGDLLTNSDSYYYINEVPYINTL
jgi:hypothetical protein